MEMIVAPRFGQSEGLQMAGQRDEFFQSGLVSNLRTAKASETRMKERCIIERDKCNLNGSTRIQLYENGAWRRVDRSGQEGGFGRRDSQLTIHHLVKKGGMAFGIQ